MKLKTWLRVKLLQKRKTSKFADRYRAIRWILSIVTALSVGLATILNIISKEFPRLAQKQVRKHLADCGIKKEHVMQPISTLSGGEQAKVKLCKLVLKPCNLLILDEPTNHLDADTKEELQKALTEFKGTIILVSHEASFYKDLATRIVNIEDLCIKKIR